MRSVNQSNNILTQIYLTLKLINHNRERERERNNLKYFSSIYETISYKIFLTLILDYGYY